MAVRTPIYLDNNATTPLDPRVPGKIYQLMCLRWSNRPPGNPSGQLTSYEAVKLA